MFIQIRSSARVQTLPELAPSQSLGGCREFIEPDLLLALDECRKSLRLQQVKL